MLTKLIEAINIWLIKRRINKVYNNAIKNRKVAKNQWFNEAASDGIHSTVVIEFESGHGTWINFLNGKVTAIVDIPKKND